MPEETKVKETQKAGAADIVASALNIVSQIIETQQSSNDWKVSNQAEEYAKKKQEKEFYESLTSKKTKKADAIRKQKQDKINQLAKNRKKS